VTLGCGISRSSCTGEQAHGENGEGGLDRGPHGRLPVGFHWTLSISSFLLEVISNDAIAAHA